MSTKYRQGRSKENKDWRMIAMRSFFILFSGVIVIRLFMLQVVNASFYTTLAEGQYSFYQELFAKRGNIIVKDWKDGAEFLAATNEKRAFIYADPRKIKDPEVTAKALAKELGYAIPENNISVDTNATDNVEMENQDVSASENIIDMVKGESDQKDKEEPEALNLTNKNESGENIVDSELKNEEKKINEFEQYKTLLKRLSKKDDPYEPIKRGVSEDVLDKILELDLLGIEYALEDARAYPEKNIGGQIFGFAKRGDDNITVGQYGLEGYFNDFLAGKNGFLNSETDAGGRWIGVGKRNIQPTIDGSDLVLTIDRTVQYTACKILKQGVERYDAESGSVIIIEPRTGKLIAMCNVPDFNPAEYNNVDDIAIYNNLSIFTAYEPGSVFKPITMSGAIDVGAVTPNTLYNDTGEEVVDDYTIRNSDLKSHGTVSMTQVLELSLNTGMVFVSRQMGSDVLREYVERFGFGKITGIELDTESSGTIVSLSKKAEIYSATGSYGQGLTVTPLQLTVGYAAIANGGMLMKPYIVEEKRYKNGSVEITQPRQISQVISKKTATTVSAMLVSVVENGYGKLAKVKGYYMAGKTGTAQVALSNGRGYDRNETIATYSGFGPIQNPRFAMTVVLNKPKAVPWAADTSAPIWGEIAEFLVEYFDIAPTRVNENE